MWIVYESLWIVCKSIVCVRVFLIESFCSRLQNKNIIDISLE